MALEADGDKDIWDADLRGMPLGLVVGESMKELEEWCVLHAIWF